MGCITSKQGSGAQSIQDFKGSSDSGESAGCQEQQDTANIQAQATAVWCQQQQHSSSSSSIEPLPSLQSAAHNKFSRGQTVAQQAQHRDGSHPTLAAADTKHLQPPPAVGGAQVQAGSTAAKHTVPPAEAQEGSAAHPAFSGPSLQQKQETGAASGRPQATGSAQDKPSVKAPDLSDEEFVRLWRQAQGTCTSCQLKVDRGYPRRPFWSGETGAQALSSKPHGFPDCDTGSGAEEPSCSRSRRSAELAKRPRLVRHLSREPERLKVMRSFGLLNTPPEPVFDHFTDTIATIFKCPFAAMCLVDEERVYVKSGVGVSAGWGGPAYEAFCTWMLVPGQASVLVVPDARQDSRFADNRVVTGPPHIVFYAGAPLLSSRGHVIGALSVFDCKDHSFSAMDCMLLCNMCHLVMKEVEQRGPGAAEGRQELKPLQKSMSQDNLSSPSFAPAGTSEKGCVAMEDLRMVWDVLFNTNPERLRALVAGREQPCDADEQHVASLFEKMTRGRELQKKQREQASDSPSSSQTTSSLQH